MSSVDVTMTAQVRPAAPHDLNKVPVPGVRNVIAVGAGKGAWEDNGRGEPGAGLEPGGSRRVAMIQTETSTNRTFR